MDENAKTSPKKSAPGGVHAAGDGGVSNPRTDAMGTGSPDLSEVADLDRLVHEPARLGIMALLYVIDSADFTFLMNQTGLSWGNLSAHMSKLEEAGYLEVEKGFKGKRPQTTLRLTPRGREAFAGYARKMKQFFEGLPDQEE